MSDASYSRTDGAITATAIKAGAVSMAHMRAAMLGESKPQTAAMALGAMVHAAILEPDRYLDGKAIWRGGVRRGGRWEEFKAEALAAGETIISEEEIAEARRIADAVYAHPRAVRLLTGSLHEQVREWTSPLSGRGKCRLDGIAAGYWLEVKTTRATTRQAYASQHYRLGYDLQLGWYSIGAGEGLPCKLITVCTGDVPDVVVYHMPSELIAAGREKAVEIAARYRACEAAGVFAGAADGAEEVDFVAPAWAGGTGGEVEIGSGETMEASEL